MNESQLRRAAGPCPSCANMGTVCSPGSHDTMFLQNCRCGCPVSNEPFLGMMVTGLVLGAVSAVGLLSLVH